MRWGDRCYHTLNVCSVSKALKREAVHIQTQEEIQWWEERREGVGGDKGEREGGEGGEETK